MLVVFLQISKRLEALPIQLSMTSKRIKRLVFDSLNDVSDIQAAV